MKALPSILVGIALSGCGAGGTANVDAPTGNGPPSGGTLSEQYPGDVGIGGNPAVVWYEDFEAASVAAVTSRYDQSQGVARMTLVADHAPGSSGTALALRAGGGVAAVDLFKQLPDHDELYVRWYAKYEAGFRGITPASGSVATIRAPDFRARMPASARTATIASRSRSSPCGEPAARIRGSTSTTTG